MTKNKKLITVGATSLLAVGLAVAIAPRANAFKASASTKMVHFAAIMPTATSKGIREYWTNCNGGAPMFENPGISATEGTLTEAQKTAILSNAKDERIIPTLTEIQTGVTSGAKGLNAYEYDNVYNAYAYNYLDAATKSQISGETSLINAGKDALPVNENSSSVVASLGRSYDAKYGNVLSIQTATLNNKTFQAYFYGFNANKKTYGADQTLHFYAKTPFAAAGNTSQTFWCGAYATAKKFNAAPQSYTEVSGKGSELNSDGAFATAFTGAISFQRYLNSSATVGEYEGTYYMSSIFAEKVTNAEGAVVLSSSQPVTMVTTTWDKNNANGATITQGVSTEYGYATRVDMASKTTVFEAAWSGLNLTKLANYKYAVLRVYAPVSCAFFLSQENYRNKVLNVGVDSTASTNGAVADAAAKGSAKLKVGWNTFVMPTSYFHKTDLFFEIWNTTKGVENGWLISSLYGYNDLNSDGVVPVQTNFTSSYSSTSSVSKVAGENVYKITVTETKASDRFDAYLPVLDLTGYTGIKFSVKGPHAGSSFALYYDALSVDPNTSHWWPVGSAATPGVSHESFTDISYSSSDLNAGSSWASNQFGLLFLNSNGCTGDWYISVTFVK